MNENVSVELLLPEMTKLENIHISPCTVVIVIWDEQIPIITQNFTYQLSKAYIATELKSPVAIGVIGYKIATYTNTGTDVILNYIERWNSVHTDNVKI